MIVVYGLKNCDTCRKAIKWLEVQGKGAHLRDLRIDPIEAQTLEKWIAIIGWEKLLNQRSITWRNLPNLEKQQINGIKACTLMLAHPAIIKRPIFACGGQLLVGFSDKEKAALKACV
jgi:Spx/MgsR family transcriptional regulator